MAFSLPPLPWVESALEPLISAKTISFHYGKHHTAYLNKLNELTDGTAYANQSLETIIMGAAKDKGPLFNNAAQVWNHNFFWNSIKPNGGGEPQGEVASLITESFGSLDKFKEEFKNAAVSQFGSGWAWLCLDGGKFRVIKTTNAELPMLTGLKALVTCDVWEHAYYLDYQNRRPDFVQTFLDKLINWDFVAANLKA
ncbi:MAG: superoxide dismutase [Deltaproteobacteria bacterium]|nr:superoxide dismutase [Deltaproteobacteria bacterium]